jgi:molecular chaperone GrpE
MKKKNIEINPEEEIANTQESVENSTSDSENTEETAEVKDELSEMKEKYLRLYSDFENFRKRTAKEKIDLIQG